MSCPCPCENKAKYDNNCAHYTSDMMIKSDQLKKNPSGCVCCSEGRPIRAKELKVHFPGKAHTTPAPNNNNQFIYCERNRDGQGHVYFGTKTTAVAPTWTWSGADRYEYYY